MCGLGALKWLVSLGCLSEMCGFGCFTGLGNLVCYNGLAGWNISEEGVVKVGSMD